MPANGNFGALGRGRMPTGRTRLLENFDVIATDYNNYAVVYGCNDLFFSFYREAWILSRTPRLSENYVDAAKDSLEKAVGQSDNKLTPYLNSRLTEVQQGGWCNYSDLIYKAWTKAEANLGIY